jgi:predicted O-methyltransferase YrrM
VILSEQVLHYLNDLRPPSDEVMRDMEQVAERDGVPIVHWELGRLLAALCRTLDPVVLEVGTAIGYSALHMAQQLTEGRVITLERDESRIAQAREYFERAGVADRIEIVEGDARESIGGLVGPFGLLFVDGTKAEYREYIDLAQPKLAERALLVVDNVLMSGEVALPDDAPDTFWSLENRRAARAINAGFMDSPDWVGSVLPVGDGVLVAARR